MGWTGGSNGTEKDKTQCVSDKKDHMKRMHDTQSLSTYKSNKYTILCHPEAISVREYVVSTA
jgi:hypothetical protein